MKLQNLTHILIGIVCIGLLPKAQAVVPPPEGGYPGFNTAEGQAALFSLTTGAGNTALGWRSLFLDSSGSFNTGVGVGALVLNNADSNTAVGAAALLLNTTGSENTAVGAAAGPHIVAGVNNTYVGDFVGTLAADESNTIRIGDLSNGNGAGSQACFIGGIFNNFQPVGGAIVQVTLDLSNDKLGWDNGPNQGGSAKPAQRGAPVPHNAFQSGGRPQHQAMLNDKVEKLQATVAQQQKQIETLTIQLKEQAAQIQKVSVQLEASKPAPQIVKNNE